MSKRNPTISFRVEYEEKDRVDALSALLIKKYPYLTVSAIYRELMGFTSTGLISEEMRRALLPPEEVDDIQDVILPQDAGTS